VKPEQKLLLCSVVKTLLIKSYSGTFLTSSAVRQFLEECRHISEVLTPLWSVKISRSARLLLLNLCDDALTWCWIRVDSEVPGWCGAESRLAGSSLACLVLRLFNLATRPVHGVGTLLYKVFTWINTHSSPLQVTKKSSRNDNIHGKEQ